MSKLWFFQYPAGMPAMVDVAPTAYKCPKQIIFMEALPKFTVGKVLRRELRA